MVRTIDVTSEEEAKALLLRAFEAYNEWQDGDGDWETFIDWATEEEPAATPDAGIAKRLEEVRKGKW